MDATSTKKAEAPAKSDATGKRKKAKPVKQPKPSKQMVENPVVFAFRLSEVDRDKIHDAAGSGKASGFVLAAALAAAAGDVEAFKAVVSSRATK